MTQEDHRSLKQRWIEFFGRQNTPPPVNFDETSILTQPTDFHVGLVGGYYLSLPVMTAAMVASSNGQKMVFVEGGYINLPNGAYTVQYIDLRKRPLTFSITDTTLDGFKVSLTISINYKICDPVEIANVAKPLDAFLAACEAAVRKIIKDHHHREILGEPDNERTITDEDMVKSIKEQISKNQACRAFLLMDVVIKERYGDSKITELEQERRVQDKKSAIEREGIIQRQEIAEDQQTLALIEAETARLLQELQATGEANQSKILEEARRLNVELDNLRQLPDLEKAKWDTISQALHTLIQALTMSGFSRDSGYEQVLQNILGALIRSPGNLPQVPAGEPENKSGSTIINLLSPKKKKGK
ncbi:MAG: hypothetical protein Fur0043_03410 [Anaerolineales bacterium]